MAEKQRMIFALSLPERKKNLNRSPAVLAGVLKPGFVIVAADSRRHLITPEDGVMHKSTKKGTITIGIFLYRIFIGWWSDYS